MKGFVKVNGGKSSLKIRASSLTCKLARNEATDDSDCTRLTSRLERLLRLSRLSNELLVDIEDKVGQMILQNPF